jgi:hypothetical protein
MMSPKYRVAQEVVQTNLDLYIVPRNIEEISYREIVIKVKELRIPFRAGPGHRRPRSQISPRKRYQSLEVKALTFPHKYGN